ncbi:cytokine receptor family member b2 isoform X2 [Brienomyrus brachyistius]|nr:cytokine receptor family member b2 isoform X2 [Brienomyrus brachyistius]
MLTWDEGPNSTDGLCYTVKYHILNSGMWKTVSGCECVLLPITCNLTEAFSDIEESYYTEIIAILGNNTSRKVMLKSFIPKEDTFLDPPLLFLSSFVDSMRVDLKPPYDSLLSVYEMFTYTLTIVSTKNGFQFFEETTGLKGAVLPNLEPDAEYCVTVSIKNRKNTYNRTQCASTALLYNPEKEIANVSFFLLLIPFFFVFKYCYTSFFSKPSLPNVLKSVKSIDVLQISLVYDIPTCSNVLVMDSVNIISQSKNDKEKSNEEDSSEHAVTGTKKSTGNYERWTEQMDCCTHSTDNSSSTLLPVSPPSNMTENQSLSKFTVSPSKSLTVSVTGSEDIPFKCHSNNHITNQTSQDHCVRELGAGPVFQFGFKISESMINEQEEEDKESCPDINLLSVTLGKHEEEKADEQDDEDALQGSYPDNNLLSVTLRKHEEEKADEQDNEETELDSVLWWKGGGSSLPFLTDKAASSDAETCNLCTEEEENGAGCSEYLKR